MTDYVSCDRCGSSVEVPPQVQTGKPVEDEERVAFENWCLADNLPTRKDTVGQYMNGRTVVAWSAWRARSARSSDDILAATKHQQKLRTEWPCCGGL